MLMNLSEKRALRYSQGRILTEGVWWNKLKKPLIMDNEGQSNNSCIVTLTLIIRTGIVTLTLIITHYHPHYPIILINPGFRKQRSTQATDAGELAGGVVGKREGRVAKMRISL